MEETRIRLVVVDDHSIVREGLCSILRTEPDFHVVGEAGDGAEALRLVERLAPDVVLLDLKMPGSPGTDVCRAITTQRPETAVIILTAFLDSDMIYRCIQ